MGEADWTWQIGISLTGAKSFKEKKKLFKGTNLCISQWVENISEGASILYSCLTSFHGIFNFNTFIAISMIGTKQSIPVGQTLSQIWRQGRFRT